MKYYFYSFNWNKGEFNGVANGVSIDVHPIKACKQLEYENVCIMFFTEISYDEYNLFLKY